MSARSAPTKRRPKSSGKATKVVPADAHEWLSFEDRTEDRTWMFDVTFLASAWRCIFGQGCQGVLTGPAPELEQGCCSYGAHLADEDEATRVEAAAATLSDEHWQFRRLGQKKGVVKRSRDGELITRLVDEACIFLNRPDFEGGAGCAFHQAAEAAGRPHHELKPDVCWQLPLRREDSSSDDGHVTTRLSQWDRRHWGAGGEEFHWWCTEAPEAFTGHEPVYVSMRPELVAMVGRSVYDQLAAYLDERTTSRPVGTTANAIGVLLPHPTVRRR